MDWTSQRSTDHADDVHVIPRADLIDHPFNDDCPCGPRCEPVARADGTYGWLYVHHSLDGREHHE